MSRRWPSAAAGLSGVLLLGGVVAGATLGGLLAGGREQPPPVAPAPPAAPVTATAPGAGGLPALPVPAAAVAGAPSAPAPGVQPSAPPGSVWMPGVEDTGSIETGDWRDTVAAALGPRAAARLPLNASALPTRIAEGSRPELSGAATVSVVEPELQGWDGGEWWFGPRGLVRVKEAER